MATTPNIPNTDRIVSYSPVGSTAAFIVPWVVIADSEILAEDDLVVIVNGATLSSAQFSFAGNVIAGLSGIWNGGTVTLTTAVAGVRVIIYSARDPQRIGNFLEGKSLPFTTLDKLVDDETVQLRDLALRVSRSFKTSAADYFDSGDAEMSFGIGTLEAVVAAYLAGISPATAVSGWARTLATAKALYAAPVVLSNGHTIAVAQRSTVGDGYGGVFSYDSSDAASTFSQDALGFVDNQGRRFKRVWAGDIASVQWFGAVGDDATDDFTALQAAFTTARNVLLAPKSYYYQGTLVVAANSRIVGSGPATALRQKTGNNVVNIDVSVANVTLSDFSMTGYGTNVIAVGPNATASNVKIERVHFVPTVATALSQCVALYVCSDVHVDKCKFVSTGYGVLQIANKLASNIKVTRCLFSDMYGDAINFNGANVAATALQILVEGNTFLGSHGFPTPATELRFLAFTAGSSAIVRDNYIQNSCGDAAIHIEVIAGSQRNRVIISGNTFVDNVPSNAAGNDGVIYILSSLADIEVTGNWFVQTNALTGNYALSFASGSYGTKCVFSNNFVHDRDGANSFGGVDFSFYNGQAIVSNNYMESLDKAFLLFSVTGSIDFLGNHVVSSNYGVYSSNVAGATGGGGDNITIEGNNIDAGTYCVRSGKNAAATSPPTKWCVRNNRFTSTFGAHSGVLVTDAVNSWGAGNWYGSNLVNTTIASAAGANTSEKNDFKEGTGLIHP